MGEGHGGQPVARELGVGGTEARLVKLEGEKGALQGQRCAQRSARRRRSRCLWWVVSGSSGEHGARTSLDDGGAWTDVQLCGDEGDVGEVENLCAMGEGEGPELGRRRRRWTKPRPALEGTLEP